MNHEDHVHLLRGGVPAPQPDGVWADLGSGWGAFTLALADILGPGATIHSVDKDRSSLRGQETEMRALFPAANVHYVQADFTKRLNLTALDGIVMANALHFVRRKEPVLDMIRSYLKPEGRLILVEYNADFGNPWVPFPLSYHAWESLASRCGFASTQLLTTVPSRFLHEIYSALSLVGSRR